jgi:hypothetical protein
MPHTPTIQYFLARLLIAVFIKSEYRPKARCNLHIWESLPVISVLLYTAVISQRIRKETYRIESSLNDKLIAARAAVLTYKTFPSQIMKIQNGEMKWGLPSLLWHSSQLWRQICQLYASTAILIQRNTLFQIYFRYWVDPSFTKYGQKC